MTYQLTAPNADTVSFIGSESDPAHRAWIIYGTAYTDDEALVPYAERQGYTVATVDGIPPVYAAAVARLDAYPTKYKNPLVDGADPDSRFIYDGPDGTPIDIRDVISGVTTI